MLSLLISFPYSVGCHCRPEVCRTLHFGQIGVSNSQYSQYLESIKLNDAFVPFTELDISYLQKEEWDRNYLAQVRASKLLTNREELQRVVESTGPVAVGKPEEYRLIYDSFDGRGDAMSFSRLASWTGAMDNIKAGVPRTAYKGIVSLWEGSVKVHLVPKSFS